MKTIKQTLTRTSGKPLLALQWEIRDFGLSGKGHDTRINSPAAIDLMT
jgi:hypothetical protein